jgi:hypothetical protein
MEYLLGIFRRKPLFCDAVNLVLPPLADRHDENHEPGILHLINQAIAGTAEFDLAAIGESA